MAGLLSLGARAMFANQAALQTIGQNIANANTVGYSRQSVTLTTSPGQYTGAGFFGKGVDVQTVVRSHNEFLTKEAASSKSTASADATRAEQLSRMEKIFQPGTEGLGYAASQFLNAMVDVTSRPSDPSARQVALGRASEMAVRFANAGAQLTDLQSGVVSDLKASVTVVNQLAQQIANVNDQISKTRGSGHTPNDLLDQRDRLISQLGEYVAVTTLPADDDTVGVFIGGGQRLVLGNQASALQVSADSYDPQRAVLSLKEGNINRALDESVLTGGSMAALLAFQNSDLQDAKNMLGQLAAAIGTRVNDQNALGLNLSNPPGKGGNIFNVAAPRVMAAASNARNPDGSLVSGVQASIVNAGQLQASSYKLTSSAPGSYEVTRLSDGLVRTVNDGDTLDGFQISFAPSAPAVGESFLIEPVGSAALEMRRVLDNPNGLAAASPLTASASVNNTGTASVDSVYAVNGSFDAARAPITLEFGDPDPANAANLQYTLTLADGSVLSGIWSPGQPIGNQPAAGIDLGFELRTNGVPRKGDRIALDPTIYTATNNGNAKAFLNIQSEGFVGRQLQPDGSITAGATITDAYASTMSEIGARVQSAGYLSGVSTSVAADAEATRAGQAGVNLDEEAARLMQFQQNYQAAAKVLQTAQALFDELMRIAAR
ncbi:MULTISPECIES: flagellar hook-associated protein FlgK [Roseateles]|uniref:Flagellar hook-associated protein 1 n=1 Tax=Pelomonas aquatica TaxID=431058 RepID=A0ABU1Z4Q8_9BURK|nr:MULTISPECIES: flagellar hook-associated protein FlgK [Roseateles]KQY81913.1 flagellar hook protein [Pelomonas sp. Root1444]MDR7295588.1 flagellar hook-associated protein 1 FlgK [Pelomonas aquatica]